MAKNYRRKARRYAQRHGINPTLFERQIGAESGFNPRAGSRAGARGIAQIMPATARAWGVNPDDPNAALNAAAEHMSGYLKAYHGSWAKALTAYNAGPGKVGGSLPAETRAYISTVLGGKSDTKDTGGGSAATPDRFVTEKVSSFDEAGFKKAQGLQLLSSIIAKHRGTDSPLFKTGILSTTDPVSKDFLKTTLKGHTVKGTPATGADSNARSSDAPNSVARMQRIAEKVSSLGLNYQWGGGHGATPAKVGTPVDCSGYVSQILGVSPRVSGQFSKWGKPGHGKQVTVYSNSGHVLMQVGNRWYATSRSNRGGGAGRIAPPTRAYLSAFTARHPRGL